MFKLVPRVYVPTQHPFYHIWRMMIARCYNPNNTSYEDYGGRGIRVCKRWRKGDGHNTGFECFVADMGLKPSPKHELDRRDVDGHYTPKNCRWVTERVQVNNRTITRRVVYCDKLTPLYVACEKAGINKDDVNNRVYYKKMTLQAAFDSVLKNSGKMRRIGLWVTHEGKTLLVREACESFGVAYHHVKRRIYQQGMTAQQAFDSVLTSPPTTRGTVRVYVKYEGERLGLPEACKRAEVALHLVKDRVYRQGMTWQQAFDWVDQNYINIKRWRRSDLDKSLSKPKVE